MKKNNVILLLLGMLFLLYLYLYANEFEIRVRTEFWIILAEMIVVLIMMILLLILNVEWWLKLVSLISFVVFLVFALPRTGLWNYSVKNYVEKEKSQYINFVNEIDKIEKERLSYISCRNNQITSRPKLNSIDIEGVSNSICEYIQRLDCVEVSLSRKANKYLFVMSRAFIDNGYGLLYCKEELNIEEIFDERINGLEITSVSKVDEHWYYVSFT